MRCGSARDAPSHLLNDRGYLPREQLHRRHDLFVGEPAHVHEEHHPFDAELADRRQLSDDRVLAAEQGAVAQVDVEVERAATPAPVVD